MPEPVIIVASGDLRLAANQVCWPAQAQAEEAVMAAIRSEGREVRRGHPCDPAKGHGFIDSQKYGMEVFRNMPPEAPLIVAEAVWQYSHHVLSGLYRIAARSSPSPTGAASGPAWSACSTSTPR